MARALQKRLKTLHRALLHAETYESWRQIAGKIDGLTGAAAWRAEEDTPELNGRRLRADIRQMSERQAHGDAPGLTRLLHVSLHQTIGDLTGARLYDVALTGTKHLVDDYLDAVGAALQWLVDAPGLTRHHKRQMVEQADRVHGRPALLLSGGATLGFYHLGVVKALWEQNLLPEVLCGASMGAMVAGGIATRTDAELAEMWDHPEDLRRVGIKWAGFRSAFARGAVLKPDVMAQTVRHNVGRWTFREAFDRTGRSLNVSISPTRQGQSPRLLSHLTAPDVFIDRAALASGAIPVAFPPVGLTARGPGGNEIPYLPDETWMDGSMHGDLPKMRLARLHNINRFIVSQTNPHVLPFLGLRERDNLLSSVTRLFARNIWSQSHQAMQIAARLAEPTPLQGWTDLAAHVTRQEWRGDIDIHPRFRWTLYRRVFSNPTLDELRLFILEGERATWPRIETIRQHTRLSRMLQATLAALDASESMVRTAK
ncbi:MAG: DUF3336 domain-containing protein [Myxococcota bacterium]